MATIELIDSFEWCGGQGRFSPGVLGSGANKGATYWFGGMFGALAFTTVLSFYWPGDATRWIAHLYTPLFNPFPAGGCKPDAEPPVGCRSDFVQLQLGSLGVDAAGNLFFSGNAYFGGDLNTPSAFVAATAGGSKRLVGRTWNTVELKMEIAGAVMSLGGDGCGDVDPNMAGAYGLTAARINGTEGMRYRERAGLSGKVLYTPCACVLCEQFPLGVGAITLVANDVEFGGPGIDDFVLRTWNMTAGEDPWIADATAVLLPAAGAGSSAGWTPVGAATNHEAAATNDGATSYNRTNQVNKRDALALAPSVDTTSVVLAAQPLVVARAEYKEGAGPPVRAFYRRAGTDYATGNLALPTTFSPASDAAGVPVMGETLASLSAGEIGYTTE